MPPRDPQNAVVLERIEHHEGLATFRIGYVDGRRPEFKPGQYATLGLHGPEPDDGKPAKLVRRMYSVASAATDPAAVSFYIVKVDEGALTPSLFDLNVGDTLFMAERFGGHFTLDPVPASHRVVCVGTGTGLAPFRSMYLTFRGESSKRWNKFVLLDGCRVARDLAYCDELSAMSAADPDFVYLPTVTREPEDSGWAGARGRVNALLGEQAFADHTGFSLDPSCTSVLLCGNPQMIDQVEADLGARGFVTHGRKTPEGTLHFERYW